MLELAFNDKRKPLPQMPQAQVRHCNAKIQIARLLNQRIQKKKSEQRK
jgi:hypothetical protein